MATPMEDVYHTAPTNDTQKTPTAKYDRAKAIVDAAAPLRAAYATAFSTGALPAFKNPTP